MAGEFRIEDVIRPEVLGLTAYHVDGASCPVKLDANESPFAPSAALQEALQEAMRGIPLHRYPDPEAQELRHLLARRLGVSVDQLLLGNGSDELIQILLMAVAGPGVAVMAPIPTFSVYETVGRALGLRFVGVPLDPRFHFDTTTWRKALEQEHPRAVFIASPNNPTGNCLDEALIRETLDLCRGLVIVDEAYADYSGRTILSELPRRPNLVILRTLSKIGLAGVRLGILAAPPSVISELNKVRMPYNINVLSQVAARVALEHEAEIQANLKAIRRERDGLRAALVAYPDVEIFPSDANFFLIRTPFPADVVHRELARRGVSVRRFGSDPALARCLRVTVGRPEENSRFLEALKGALEEAKSEAGRVSDPGQRAGART